MGHERTDDKITTPLHVHNVPRAFGATDDTGGNRPLLLEAEALQELEEKVQRGVLLRNIRI